MTIDEAIIHAEEVAKDEELKCYIVNKKFDAITTYGEEHHKCANEHRQLAEWLKELKKYKVLFDSPEEAEEMMNMYMV